MRRACWELPANEERGSIIAVARMLGVERQVIDLPPMLGASVRGRRPRNGAEDHDDRRRCISFDFLLTAHAARYRDQSLTGLTEDQPVHSYPIKTQGGSE